MGLRSLVKECVLRVLKENLGTTPSPDQPNPKVVSEKTIQVLKKWMEQAGSRDAAKRLIDFILKRRLGLGTDDLADTATFANGLDAVSEALEQQDWRGAIDIAKDTANEMIADEGGEGMEENTSPTATEDPKDAYYVQYHSQRQGEIPFTLGDRKFEYVNGLYPDGKVDIAVYSFAGDLCYGYKAFRQMMNIQEGFDPTSVGPNPDASEGNSVHDPYASMNAKMRQMEMVGPVASLSVAAEKELRADIESLKQKHPNLSFGYLGNYESDPRIGDNRAWYVFYVKNGTRQKWGGFDTKDLPQMWKQWQTAKEKVLGENLGRYAQLAGATDLKEADKDCQRCKGQGGYFAKIGHGSQPSTHWVSCDMPGCTGGKMNSVANSLYNLFGTTEIEKVQDKDLQQLVDPKTTYRPELKAAAQAELEKRAETLKESEGHKSFRAIKNELDPDGTKHDLTLSCVKCGTTETCRCSKPKRKVQGVCDKCSGLNEDAFDQFREIAGAEKVNEFLAKFGLGPNYKPAAPKKHKCPKCKKENAQWHEEGADCDGGQNEMVLECPDCGHSES